jgi:hypothetical protein
MVDLRTIDLVYLHGPHRPERREHMEKMLKEKGLRGESFTGVCDQGAKSGATSWIKLLESRLVADFHPFVCLEDDCSATPWFRRDISIPEDADGVYLGISVYGLHPMTGLGYPQVQMSPVSSELVRIYNMLSTHALLFMTRAWAQKCLECVRQALDTELPGSWDIPIARSMADYKVYALKSPLFYQDSKMGGQEEPTLIEF